MASAVRVLRVCSPTLTLQRVLRAPHPNGSVSPASDPPHTGRARSLCISTGCTKTGLSLASAPLLVGLSFTRPSLDDSLCLVCTFEAAFPGRSLGEGNGSPLQYSWLENPMDRGSRQAMYRPWGRRVGLTEHACAMGHKAFRFAPRVLRQAVQSLFGGRAPPCVLRALPLFLVLPCNGHGELTRLLLFLLFMKGISCSFAS